MNTIQLKIVLSICLASMLSLLLTCKSTNTQVQDPDLSGDTLSTNIQTIKYADLAVCNALDIQTWDFVKKQKRGLYGYREEMNGGFVGAPSLRKKYLGFININNWFPLLPQKIACCGQFHHFKTHNRGDENDWNLFILPDQYSRFIIDYALPHRGNSHFNTGGGAKWSTCLVDGDCIEAEITAVQNSVINSILPRELDDNDTFVPSIVGDTICIYGPAVREYVHNNRPEIHPAEIIWWRSNPDTHHVLVVQDASKRFGSKNRYKNVNNEPGPWQPWAQAPITTNVQIPFELKASETDTLEFHLYEESSENIMASANSPYDQSDNPTTILRVDRNDRIIVHEHQNRDQDLGVSFVNICRQSSDEIFGFLNISINVGAGTNENQGIFYLKIEKNKATPAIVAPMALTRSATQNFPVDSSLNLEVKSITPKVMNGKPTLTADVAVFDPNQNQTSLVSFSLDSNNQSSNPLLSEGQQLPNEWLRSLQSDSIAPWISNVAVFAPNVPDYSLLPLEESLQKERTAATENAVTIFRKYIGGNQIKNEFIKHNKWIKLSTYPYYCSSDEGDCDLEESSEVLDSLNLWASNPENLLNYGNEWNISAEDAFTNEPVNIHYGDSLTGNAPIWVEFLSEKFNASAIRIHFLGSPNTVYRITATAFMYDPFSNQGQQTYTFLSHEVVSPPISLTDNSALLEDMVKGLGISYEDKFKSRWEKRINGSPALIYLPGTIIPDRKEMAYQATLNYYIQILDDGTITEQELDGLEKSIQLTEEF